MMRVLISHLFALEAQQKKICKKVQYLSNNKTRKVALSQQSLVSTFQKFLLKHARMFHRVVSMGILITQEKQLLTVYE